MSTPDARDVFVRQFLDETVNILTGKSRPRIRKCLQELSQQEIWRRPNENLASVGNLVLHLCGNVRQWIISGIGGEKDRRERWKEFDEKGPIPRDELLRRLESTLDEAAEVIRKADITALVQPRTIQGELTTGVIAIYHVCEHFSYHTGQISLHTKLLKNIDLGYYKKRDLNVTN
jgi:uncharacterized damage-inducible protein DinB